MDANHYNGDVDPREFGPDMDEERCWSCGASEDEDCTPDCLCRHCCLKAPAMPKDAR